MEKRERERELEKIYQTLNQTNLDFYEFLMEIRGVENERKHQSNASRL